ncbi:MAG: TlyA family RNA methyltransferase [Clostridia bacterium]|nr:TlyA family RNA methyltransferase [Clostridia bacterium]
MSERLDIQLFKRGMAKSREKAKDMITQGIVYVNTKQILKPSFILEDEDTVEIHGEVLPYVSRGGYKLEKALSVFEISVEGKTAVDMGASTGGFTDVMLQNGISKVYAVDVGHNQLDEKIRNNNKVVNMENTNIRNLTKEDFYDKIQFIAIDTSFISLTLILPVAFSIIEEDGDIVALIKPQFEVGKGNLGKGGVVKNSKLRDNAVKKIQSFVALSGFKVMDTIPSPINGGDGNIEYLIHIKKQQ